MDPQETLRQLADALKANDWETAADLRDILREWLDRGGFGPNWSTPEGSYVMDTLHNVNRIGRP